MAQTSDIINSMILRNKKSQITDMCNNAYDSQMHCAERKKLDSEGYSLQNPISIIFWRRKPIEKSVAKDQGLRGTSDYKGAAQGI